MSKSKNTPVNKLVGVSAGYLSRIAPASLEEAKAKLSAVYGDRLGEDGVSAIAEKWWAKRQASSAQPKPKRKRVVKRRRGRPAMGVRKSRPASQRPAKKKPGRKVRLTLEDVRTARLLEKKVLQLTRTIESEMETLVKMVKQLGGPEKAAELLSVFAD